MAHHMGVIYVQSGPSGKSELDQVSDFQWKKRQWIDRFNGFISVLVKVKTVHEWIVQVTTQWLIVYGKTNHTV